MKKTLALLLVCFMLLPLFAACSSEVSSPKVDSPSIDNNPVQNVRPYTVESAYSRALALGYKGSFAGFVATLNSTADTGDIVNVFVVDNRLYVAMSTSAVIDFGELIVQTPDNGDDDNNDNNAPAFQIPENGYDGSEVTITFYHTMGSGIRDVLDKYITEFNRLYPNITIHEEQIGDYDDVRDQIKAEIPVGNQPNIAYCYPDHVALYNIADVVVTLDDLINSQISVTRADGTTEMLGLTQEQKDDFIQGYYEEGMSFGDGLMYTMPFSKSTEVLYYNKTFFEQHNLNVPTTWEEMEALCAAIKEIDPDCIPLGYDSEGNWFITMCEQYGYDYISADTDDHFLFDNDGTKGFVKKFREWYQKGYVTTQGLYGKYTSNLFVTTAADEPKSYMTIGSSAGATHQRPNKYNGNYPFEVGIAPIPQVDTANGKVISQGPSVCIFGKDNPQEVLASWLFVKFLTTSVAFQAEFSLASGYVPVLKSVAQNEIYADFLAQADGGDHIMALALQTCLEQADYYFSLPAFLGCATARKQVSYLMYTIFALPEAGLDAAIDKAFKDAINECKSNT